MEFNFQLKKLIEKALNVSENAYAKYSNFKVGALVISDNGNEYLGVNVENKSYGLTICAERSAISNAITNGMKKIKRIVIVSQSENMVSPCGACREVIMEFADNETEVITASKNGEFRMYKATDLLPFGFNLNDMSI